MPQLRRSRDVDVSSFLQDALAVKQHLSRYLNLSGGGGAVAAAQHR